jgi:hypothetical protein
MRLRFFGYADEPNDLKFISGFLGSEHVKRLRKLEHGSFIHYASGKLSLVNIESYESQIVKTEVRPSVPQAISLDPIKRSHSESTNLTVLIRFAMIVLFGILLIKAISL